MTRNTLIFLCLCLCLCLQSQAQQYWQDTDENQIPRTGERQIIPVSYRTLKLDTDQLLTLLREAPAEGETDASESRAILEIPLPDGGFERFRIVEYRMMEEGLSSRYPEIKTYRGISVDDQRRRIRIDWTERGFRAMLRWPGGSFFIDPYARGGREYYISYFKRNYSGTGDLFQCFTEAGEIRPDVEDISGDRAGDCVFRSYRTAVATTGEYSNFHGATSAAQAGLVLSEVTTAINRVNEVYEVDVAVRLVLIANTDDVFYYDGSTDPFTNGNGVTMLGQNQTNMTSVIGSANYDIGHVFSTGGGGVASLQVPCNNGSKARGVTGLTNPINDPFYIDYVAHEMGHQFGGNHTQYNGCNRNSSTAMEPGSASTIMGYAGICNPNVQSNSDAYFHGISVQEIKNFVTNGNGNSCDLPVVFNNTPPVVVALPDYIIPKSTPFMLTAVANDDDGDPLSYCWEEWDNDGSDPQPPQPTNDQGPMFRSLFPNSSPTRYFPDLEAIVNNSTPTWEVLPSIGRQMEFRISVRDYHDVAGCTDEDNLFVTTSSGAGPFLVTHPNTPAIWYEFENKTISWDVANTNTSPVNCGTVDILLSKDGGFSYPVILAEGVSNDGSHIIQVPEGESEQCRIMVKCASSVFFDISDEDFVIERPGFILETPSTTLAFCDETTASLPLEIIPQLGFMEEVNLIAINLPPGASLSFSSNPVIPPASLTMELSGIQSIPMGEYITSIQGESATGSFSIQLHISKQEPPADFELIAPQDEGTDIPPYVVLEWEDLGPQVDYWLQFATDAGFNDLLIDEAFQDNEYQIFSGTELLTEYFWRVRPFNICGDGGWSETWTFTTSACASLESTDVPVAISSGSPSTVTSSIHFPFQGTITDVNIPEISGLHSYMGDLTFTLISPNNTEVILVDGICNTQNNFDFGFDDAANTFPPCPPTSGLIHQPEEALSNFNAIPAMGEWILSIRDNFNQDGGSLNAWSLEVCDNSVHCNPIVKSTEDSGDGSLREMLSCAAPGDTIHFTPDLDGNAINLLSPILFSQDVTLFVPPELNITISAQLAEYAFEVAPEVDCRIEGLKIITGLSAEGGGLRNYGSTTLDNVILEENPLNPFGDDWITNHAELRIEGNCHLEKL